ncbi:PYM1-like protein [Mya arenaria]|uniref:PYM1-like protein n=1 Tax=Mya arenaria TaxID=6604 RepID=A0ABY7D9Q1_MYAAR|nr:partner of Y14 and mago-like [Mya arenaria]WAQ94379.1 PYM1-like protein [Mya arenaria]
MAAAPIERTGIVQDELTGEKFIPASRRPDGSWRKPRRVKEGYVPQEEVPTYENKGVQWQKSSMSSLPPGLNPDTAPQASNKQPSENTDNMSKAAKKNAKRKEKKKQQDGQTVSVTQSGLPVVNISEQMARTSLNAKKDKVEGDKQDTLRKVRQLRKKVKQIEDLERRIETGELKQPEKDQLDKISKKQSLVDEMEELQLELDD